MIGVCIRAALVALFYAAVTSLAFDLGKANIAALLQGVN